MAAEESGHVLFAVLLRGIGRVPGRQVLIKTPAIAFEQSVQRGHHLLVEQLRVRGSARVRLDRTWVEGTSDRTSQKVVARNGELVSRNWRNRSARFMPEHHVVQVR